MEEFIHNLSPSDRREFRSRMKRIFTDFAAIESLSIEEEGARKDLEKELRLIPRSLDVLFGMAEAVNIVTRLYPFASEDTAYRLVARLVMVVTSKLGLEAIQEEEEGPESFPEELDNE